MSDGIIRKSLLVRGVEAPGKSFCATGPPSLVPRLARRIVIGSELSSKMPPRAVSFVRWKSRMLGLPVAKLAAFRENSTRCERSMLFEWGSSWIRLVRCGSKKAPTPKTSGTSSVSGVNGGALTNGEPPLALASASETPADEPDEEPSEVSRPKKPAHCS